MARERGARPAETAAGRKGSVNTARRALWTSWGSTSARRKWLHVRCAGQRWQASLHVHLHAVRAWVAGDEPPRTPVDSDGHDSHMQNGHDPSRCKNAPRARFGHTDPCYPVIASTAPLFGAAICKAAQTTPGNVTVPVARSVPPGVRAPPADRAPLPSADYRQRPLTLPTRPAGPSTDAWNQSPLRKAEAASRSLATPACATRLRGSVAHPHRRPAWGGIDGVPREEAERARNPPLPEHRHPPGWRWHLWVAGGVSRLATSFSLPPLSGDAPPTPAWAVRKKAAGRSASRCGGRPQRHRPVARPSARAEGVAKSNLVGGCGGPSRRCCRPRYCHFRSHHPHHHHNHYHDNHHYHRRPPPRRATAIAPPAGGRSMKA